MNFSTFLFQIVDKISDEISLSYQITTGWYPVVDPRDFLFLIALAKMRDIWIAGGCSVDHPSYNVNDGMVRAWQHPTCMVVEPSKKTEGISTFTWLLQCDFGGMLPSEMCNAAIPHAIGLFLSSLREEVS